MATPSPSFDPETLRQDLMAPEPMKRVTALHALEIGPGPGACAQRAALAGAAARFAARGIPFYAVHDPHYCAWVSKAVDFWQRLQVAPAGTATAHA